MKRAQGGYEEKVITGNQLKNSASKPQTRHDILFQHHKYIKEKKNEIVESNKDKELEHCTFKPIIREYKITDPKAVVDFDLSDLSSPYSSLKYTPSSSTQDLRKSNRHNLLYEAGRVQKEKMKQKIYEIRKQEEERELAECTFKPKIKPLSEESPLKLKALQSGTPKGYEKAVERLQIAEKIREVKKYERERIPCGENYERLRNTKFQPPSFLTRNKVKKEDLLVYVDVNISPGKTGRIGIHKGSDANELAKNFAKTYSLPPVMKDSLAKLLQSYIDTYFPETTPNFEVYPHVIEISERDHGNYENEGYEVRREFYRSNEDVERKYEEREEKNGNEEHEEHEEQEEQEENIEHVEQEQKVQEEQMEHKEENHEELENENL